MHVCKLHLRTAYTRIEHYERRISLARGAYLWSAVVARESRVRKLRGSVLRRTPDAMHIETSVQLVLLHSDPRSTRALLSRLGTNNSTSTSTLQSTPSINTHRIFGAQTPNGLHRLQLWIISAIEISDRPTLCYQWLVWMIYTSDEFVWIFSM